MINIGVFFFLKNKIGIETFEIVFFFVKKFPVFLINFFFFDFDLNSKCLRLISVNSNSNSNNNYIVDEKFKIKKKTIN